MNDLLLALGTIVPTIFIAELTDKDALLLLALATRRNPWTVFAAGSTAFTITTGLIVSVGYVLIQFVPVSWIKLAGGAVMIGYAFWQLFFEKGEEKDIQKEEQRFLQSGLGESKKQSERKKKSAWSIFLGAVLLLALLDLAGDATEVLTIVFVARFEDILLVFVGCVAALVAASAVETTIGNRFGQVLSVKRLKIFSFLVFLILGSLVILTSLYPTLLPPIF